MLHSHSVGALTVLYNEQLESGIEMIKSFRKNNPQSSIVIYTDGLIHNINQICKDYNCISVIYHEKIGYPASENIDVPLTYLHRFFNCAQLIKEDYYINLESDCLVTDTLTVDTDDAILISNIPPMWSFYLSGNESLRNFILPRMIDLYNQHNICTKRQFLDVVVGGGGFIYNKKLFINVFNNWDKFVSTIYQIKKIYDEPVDLWTHKMIWYQDYILSLNLPFYLDNTYEYQKDSYINGKTNITSKINHPYKKFYK
jgi:hypothetical protein